MNWHMIIEDEWYYIPALLILSIWSFNLGLFIGWILIKLG